MHTVVIPTTAPPAAAVVSACEITRRYGAGDTAVDALRGVSLDVASGELTAIMGLALCEKPSLMYIHGGLGKPTAGEVAFGGMDTTHLDAAILTDFPRDHIGFVFHCF